MFKIVIFLLVIQFTVFSINAKAQHNLKVVDPSKPTNLYSTIGLAFDYKSAPLQNTYGVRGSISYAINTDNLLLAEVPVLRNDLTEKTGLSDVRLRYFTAVKRDISPMFIAIAPFLDITMPTGKFEDGLGTSCWAISAGGVAGLMFSERLGLFPGLGIMYITKPGTGLIPESEKYSGTGIAFQFNASYSFDKDTYIFLNPTPSIMNFNGVWKANWSGEVSLNHMFIPNKLQAGLYWGPNFTDKTNSFRLGLSSFL